MKISQVLESKGHAVEMIRPDQSAREAATRLSLRRIGALVVSTDGIHVEGVLSERDVVHGLARFGESMLDQPVREIMTRHITTCSADDTVVHVMEEMTRTRNRHVPVLSGGRLIGLVSIGDLVKMRLDEVQMEAGVLRDVYLATH